MKQYWIRGMAFLLILALTMGMAACTQAGGGQETVSQETDLQDATCEVSTDASSSAATEPSTDSSTPNFTVLDAEGKEVTLSDFFGTPIVLNFWASWCPPCKAELPDFEEACKKYEGKVVFLMVNMTDGDRETVKIAKDFVNSMGYTFPVYFDTEYEAAYAYGVRSIPTTYFINADGSVEAHATGMISAVQLEQGIGMIYAE